VDRRQTGVAHGAPTEANGEVIPGEPGRTPSDVVPDREGVVAGPAGEGGEGTRLPGGRQRNVRGDNRPVGGGEPQEAASTRITTEDDRLVNEPFDLSPADRNNRIRALDIFIQGRR